MSSSVNHPAEPTCGACQMGGTACHNHIEAHDLASALAMLQALRVGDPVTVEVDGRTHALDVQREWHRRDGGGFGSADHAAVIVGFGPGRWNTDISAARIVAGYANLTPGHPAKIGA